MKIFFKSILLLMIIIAEAWAGQLPIADKYRLKDHQQLTTEQLNELAPELQNLTKKYEESYRQHAQFKALQTQNSYLRKMSITYGEGLVELPKNVPVLGGVIAVAAESARDAIDRIHKVTIENSEQAFIETTNNYLAVFVNETSGDELRKLLADAKANPEQAMKRLTDTTGLLKSDLYKNLDDKNKTAFQNAAIEKLASDVSIIEIETKSQLSNLNEKVVESEKKAIKAIALNRIVYQATMSGMAEMVSATENVQTSIVDFSNKVAGYHEENMEAHQKSHGFLDRMEDYVYQGMSPEDQLKSLNNGWRPELKGEQRKLKVAELKLKVKVIDRNRTIVTGLSKLSGNLNNLASIASDLGVSTKVQKVLSDSAKIGGAALKVATSLSSGNILGAISAVTGLFAKKKDPAAERHKQVMAAFGKVFENQGEMLKKLDELIDGQNKIMNNQAKIHDAIVALSKQSHLQYITLGNQIVDLKNVVFSGQAIGMSNYTDDINKCAAFLPKNRLTGEVVPFSQLSYKEFAEHMRDRGHTFQACMSGLDQMLPNISNSESLEPYFYLESYLFQGANIAEYTEQIVNPIMNYHRMNVVDEDEAMKSNFRQLEKLVNIPVVLSLAETLIDLQPYFQVLDDSISPGMALLNPQALSLSDLQRTGPVPRITGKLHMESLVDIVDSAITQIKMLAGAGVLEQVESDIFSNDLQTQIKAGNALIANTDLQNNIILGSILRKLKAEEVDPGAYGHLYTTNSEAVIKSLLSNPNWQVSRSESTGHWQVSVDIVFLNNKSQQEPQKQTLVIAVPQPHQVQSKGLHYQTEIHSLLKIKNLLVDEIIQYSLWGGADDWLKKTYINTL